MNDTNTDMRMPEAFHTKHHAHTGPILGVLILALVLILGGLYLWGGMLVIEEPGTTQTPLVNNEPETPRATVDQEIAGTVSTSDELDAIDADLGSTNLDTLDTDMTAIDAEFGNAGQ